MKRWLITCGLVALVLPITASRAQAPAASGRIAGTVTSAESGEPVQGATVSIVGTRFGAISATGGRYTIAPLAPGLYRVRLSMIGFAPVVVDSVPVKAGEST